MPTETTAPAGLPPAEARCSSRNTRKNPTEVEAKKQAKIAAARDESRQIRWENARRRRVLRKSSCPMMRRAGELQTRDAYEVHLMCCRERAARREKKAKAWAKRFANAFLAFVHARMREPGVDVRKSNA
jgi:hypothetical protein